MKDFNKRYNGGAVHRLALLHAVGQLEIVTGGMIKVSALQDFMCVSKPTAIKYLKELAGENEIIMSKNDEVGRFGQWEVCLSEVTENEYKLGCYKPYFASYCQRVLKVILQ